MAQMHARIKFRETLIFLRNQRRKSTKYQNISHSLKMTNGKFLEEPWVVNCLRLRGAKRPATRSFQCLKQNGKLLR